MAPLKASPAEPAWTAYDREFLRSVRIAVPAPARDEEDRPYMVAGAAITVIGFVGLLLSIREAWVERF